jgi:hypothetical protein
MFIDHPSFHAPENRNSKIWRYMNLYKFKSLLESSALRFARADTFDDVFEGSMSKVNFNKAEILFDIFNDPLIKETHNYRKSLIKLTYINCWHLDEYESAAMWKIFCSSNDGIAIQSTYNLLKGSITDTKECSIGVVSYIDYEREPFSREDAFTPFLFKRTSFKYEQELRAILLDQSKKSNELGRTATVNLNDLIQNIYVSPSTSDEYLNEIRKTVHSYGLDNNIHKSDLLKDPVY